ncbi:DUF3343 domain-containing protein [Enterococcus sp. AZ072]|uniref:DUF3343 domain-containing protein n=1 Tax=unclassified Enterococcus TaxID=2608891 RepID=UPI003D277097
MKKWLIVTFETEHAALYFSTLCKEATIAGRLMPIPRKLSAGCGISWRSETAWEEQIRTLIQENSAELDCQLVHVEL